MRRFLPIVLGAVICGAALPALAQGVQVDDAGTQVLASGSGRFVYGQISSARRDQFMLDTQTGRLWMIVCTESTGGAGCNARALEPIPYLVGGGQNSWTAPSSGK